MYRRGFSSSSPAHAEAVPESTSSRTLPGAGVVPLPSGPRSSVELWIMASRQLKSSLHPTGVERGAGKPAWHCMLESWMLGTMSERGVNSRNEALEFARRARQNLKFIEQAAAQYPDADVYVVTQLTLSLLGAIVFPKEKLLLDQIERTPLTSLGMLFSSCLSSPSLRTYH
jgi:hypothetical protein